MTESSQQADPQVHVSDPQGSEEHTDWKAEARKWEERAKASYKDSLELHELKESTSKTVSKLEAHNKKLQDEVDAFKTAQQQNEWKTTVSKETGVPVGALRGSTLEEIQDHAVMLKALLDDARKPHAPIVPEQGKQPEGEAVQGWASVARAFFGSSH